MKEIILLQARYNQHADSNLLNLLEQIDFNLVKHNVGAYYRSPLETIEHYIAGSIVFFARNFTSFANKDIDTSKMLGFLESDFVLKERYKRDAHSLRGVVEELNARIIEIVENIDDFALEAKIEFPNFVVVKPRSQLLLTFLNHNIHHRGEISAMLDILGVSNNFAGMLMM